MGRLLSFLCAKVRLLFNKKAQKSSISPAETARSDESHHFQIGQVWIFPGTCDLNGVRVVVGKIDTWPNVGTLVHVSVQGLKISTRSRPCSVIPHVPIAINAFIESGLQLLEHRSFEKERYDVNDFLKHYLEWSSSYRLGKATVIQEPLALAIPRIVQAMESK